jgi:hypothetical protein
MAAGGHAQVPPTRVGRIIPVEMEAQLERRPRLVGMADASMAVSFNRSTLIWHRTGTAPVTHRVPPGTIIDTAFVRTDNTVVMVVAPYGEAAQKRLVVIRGPQWDVDAAPEGMPTTGPVVLHDNQLRPNGTLVNAVLLPDGRTLAALVNVGWFGVNAPMGLAMWTVETGAVRGYTVIRGAQNICAVPFRSDRVMVLTVPRRTVVTIQHARLRTDDDDDDDEKAGDYIVEEFAATELDIAPRASLRGMTAGGVPPDWTVHMGLPESNFVPRLHYVAAGNQATRPAGLQYGPWGHGNMSVSIEQSTGPDDERFVPPIASSNGRWLACSTDSDVRVYDLRGEGIQLCHSSLPSPINQLVFSHDARTLYVYCMDEVGG